MLLGFNEIQIRNSPRYCRSRVENDVLMDVVVPNLETKPCIRKAKTDARRTSRRHRIAMFSASVHSANSLVWESTICTLPSNEKCASVPPALITGSHDFESKLVDTCGRDDKPLDVFPHKAILQYIAIFIWAWFGTWLLFFHSVGNFIIPTDDSSIIFQRGRLKPPTSHIVPINLLFLCYTPVGSFPATTAQLLTIHPVTGLAIEIFPLVCAKIGASAQKELCQKIQDGG